MDHSLMENIFICEDQASKKENSELKRAVIA